MIRFTPTVLTLALYVCERSYISTVLKVSIAGRIVRRLKISLFRSGMEIAP